MEVDAAHRQPEIGRSLPLHDVHQMTLDMHQIAKSALPSAGECLPVSTSSIFAEVAMEGTTSSAFTSACG